jgi:hypothetical protein
LYTSASAGTSTVTASTLSDNSATGLGAEGAGGGIANFGTLTLSNSTLSGNSGAYGAGIDNGGTLTVSNSTLSDNSATGLDIEGAGGGGIANFGTLTVSNSTLSDNSATSPYISSGGGIYNGAFAGTLTVSNSTLSGNSAVDGGGIYNYGTLTVSNSILSGNSASYGGGIANSGTLTVSNSTLSGNSASIYAGGIYTFSTHPVTLTNVTLSANRTNTDGGGLYVYSYGGSPVLHNTLIAGNLQVDNARDDVYGRLDPGGDYNLIGDGTGMTGLTNGVNGNQVGSLDNPIDPLLGPLADKGGPTLTHALLNGSPAIDAGNNAYATDWDQRGPGYPRIVNGVIDIGAFEVQAPAASRPTGPPLADPLPASGLPLPADSPGLLFSPTAFSPAPVPSVPRTIAPGREVVSGPSAVRADPWLAWAHGKARGPMFAHWPGLESSTSAESTLFDDSAPFTEHHGPPPR